MPTIRSEIQMMKRRSAALISLGETPEEVPSDPSAPEFSVMAAINGRVSWKMPVAMLVSCVLTRESGMGSCERRCWTKFSAMVECRSCVWGLFDCEVV